VHDLLHYLFSLYSVFCVVRCTLVAVRVSGPSRKLQSLSVVHSNGGLRDGTIVCSIKGYVQNRTVPSVQRKTGGLCTAQKTGLTVFRSQTR